jgi:hypothetical protein
MLFYVSKVAFCYSDFAKLVKIIQTASDLREKKITYSQNLSSILS